MKEYPFSKFRDITLNLQWQISQCEKLLSGKIHEFARRMGINPQPLSAGEGAKFESQMQKEREALDVYLYLLREFPYFAKEERTRAEGFFPDIGYPLDHVERVRLMAERLLWGY